MSQKYIGGFITKNPTAPTTSAAKGMWTLDQAANYRKQGIWPATPGTPTIGTATATGATTATVAFTAPANLGAGTVTYTATSSPGGLTGTGASSPVTVSGLTASTSYTFTVTAATPGGTSPASAASNSITTSVTPPGAVGSAYQGGFYAGSISTTANSVATHYLVVGSESTAQLQNGWKNANTATPGADSDIDGPQNTIDMVNDGNSTVYPCAHFCNNLVTGGYSDWYMPAKNELEVCYFNLKPSTATNTGNVNSGINPNSVPARTSNYTAGNPARTSAANFQTGNSEPFVASNYWTSTEKSATSGRSQTFYSGYQNYYTKTSVNLRVRAIRRVAV